MNARDIRLAKSRLRYPVLGDLEEAARRRLPYYVYDYLQGGTGEELSRRRNIEALRPEGSRAHVSLLMDLVPGREGAAIADPYHDGEEQFEYTWQDVDAAAKALVERLSEPA